jgi:hypothetical protein
VDLSHLLLFSTLVFIDLVSHTSSISGCVASDVDLSHIQATDLSLLPTSSSQFVCRLTMFFDCTLADPSSLILPVILLGAIGILRHLIPLSPPINLSESPST